MDTKRTEKMLMGIALLLLLNLIISFKPYQIVGTGSDGGNVRIFV